MAEAAATVRERVLAAAGPLFYERGIAAVGMDAIRDRAGVSMKSLYREFGSKDALVHAYLARRDEEWMAWLASRAGDPRRGPRRRLLALFGALDSWFASPGFAGCAFINAFGEAAGEGAVAERATAHKERLQLLVGELAAQLDRARAPELTEQLMLLIEGAIVRASVGRRGDAARTARRLAEAVLAGAKAPAAG